MDWDDVRATPASGAAIGENLDNLSVAELEARIASFEKEIIRVASEVAKKKAHEAAAAKLFGR